MVCRICDRDLPEIDFYKSKGVITNKTCRACRREQYLERSKGVVKKRNRPTAAGGFKHCAACGNKFPSIEFPVQRMVNKDTGKEYEILGAYCRTCNAERSRLRMRRMKERRSGGVENMKKG